MEKMDEGVSSLLKFERSDWGKAAHTRKEGYTGNVIYVFIDESSGPIDALKYW